MSSKNDNNKVVYLHKDSNGVVRYVGSGTIERAYRTEANSDRGKKYAEYVTANGRLEVEVVTEGLTKLEAEDLERELYDRYKNSIQNARRPFSVNSMIKEMFLEHLYYDESSKSCLRWKVGRVGGNGAVKIKANSEAGCLDKNGYYVVHLQGALYKAHRIIAVLHDLEVEGKVIDHIDRNKANNKIENLRVVTQQENMQNKSMQKISSANTSSAQGVSYNKQGYWVASWYEYGKQKHKCFPIKDYSSSEEAFEVACEYRVKMVEEHYSKYRKD